MDCESEDPDPNEYGYLSVTVDFLQHYGELKFYANGCEVEAVDDREICDGDSAYLIRIPVGQTELNVVSEDGYRWREDVQGEPLGCGHLDIELQRTTSFVFGIGVGPEEPRIRLPTDVVLDGDVVGSLSRVYDEDEIFADGRMYGHALFYAVEAGMLWVHPFNDAPHEVTVDFGHGGSPLVTVIGPDGIVVEGSMWVVVAFNS